MNNHENATSETNEGSTFAEKLRKLRLTKIEPPFELNPTITQERFIQQEDHTKNINKLINTTNVKPSTLADRWKSLKSPKNVTPESDTHINRNHLENGATSTKSLAERLAAKRKQENIFKLQKKDAKAIQNIDGKITNLRNSSNVMNAKELQWFKQLQKAIISSKPIMRKIPNHSLSKVASILVYKEHLNIPEKLNNESKKRKFEQIFTIHYPNTNIKKRALESFNKLSPDDIVLRAQQNAFASVTDKVQNLKISESTSNPTEQSKKKNVFEEEDEPRKDNAPFVHKYKQITVPTKPRKPVDLKEKIAEYIVNPHISFVVLGHVDAGKSTLMGRLLYDVGAVDSKLIRKLKKESNLLGKGSFHLAWVMDQTSEERERGVTVDICTSDFQTENAKFTIVDAPGHRDFINNAISGIVQSDVAVLCVDCSADAFESGFNLDGQTKEHSILARSLGIRHMVVAMNKLDCVDWDKTRFDEIKDQLSAFFELIGFDVTKQISWVPVSGLLGDGVVKPIWSSSTKQNWYKGPSLVGTLEKVAHEFVETDENLNFLTNSPFLFDILEVSASNKANECVVSGKIEQGSIQPGETITIYPSEQSCLVDQIFYQGSPMEHLTVALPGEFVSMKLLNSNSEDINSGDLCAIVGIDLHNSKSFETQLLTLDIARPLLPGTPFILYRGSCEQPAVIKRLIKVLDKRDPTKVLKNKVRHLGANQLAIVEIEFTASKKTVDLPMLTASENKQLSRIVLRKEGRTIGAGVITKLTD
ncbi:uncharacterized protein SCDLUD_003132 [Saccharomycodes ludwigii]|uniref:uncharacterized protein n=1 Tax=Saccharomycodes ludwigii TaxID=36035 RepID=UPI001E872215|nr:hypothetical protein SCDLUD_003132 [Saccharomycodes ludwigii]KAH3900162.1 hypothetical protein SCDLUD_003132 [Saccharomycodes ludwigii]